MLLLQGAEILLLATVNRAATTARSCNTKTIITHLPATTAKKCMIVA